MTNHPFIKANYPHHEGVWGWGQAADQVVMMIRNIRKSMVECEKQRYQSPNYFAPCLTSELPASIRTDHDILWDLGCKFAVAHSFLTLRLTVLLAFSLTY